ncbi:NHL repeat-containing protein [Cohnella fermenti]|uniref:Uncharacterized protein n=1 Tax=Cohnella fermenti TaxID=2565925 RepID=A0A4S4CAL3_9BACL|nr:hypothetical protein [Cohnella fermenti]THF84488.1 hypothetical protein E6C55_00440 [Cohnella fermenti]
MPHMPFSRLGQPCRNFNILASAIVTDPLDDREKLVLSNYAMGATGSLILIDPLTGEGSSLELPAGAGAWGLVNLNNEKLVVGTCVGQAYLHVLDLRTRLWAPPLVAEGETYFWQLTLGSDGNVYGGTYPGCSLIRYNPDNHSLTCLGKISNDSANLYSRPVWGEAAGYILCNYGYNSIGMIAYDLEAGAFLPFGEADEQIRWVTARFVCTEKNGTLCYYDAATLLPFDDTPGKELLPRTSVLLTNGQRIPVLRLQGNKLAGVRGQDYFVLPEPIGDVDSEEPIEVDLLRIPVSAPPTAIFSLQTDRKGLLWGSSGFGQTIFRYDPASGDSWNSSSVCNAGGEVYGMQFSGDRLFLTSYVGGDHLVYDPEVPWDQINNINPRTLQSVAPELIRPEGRSVIGPDGGIWTGWSAEYGHYGGGLSRISPDTLVIESWIDPVPGQQVAGMAADGKYVYFTTNGGASGLAHREIACSFNVWKPGRGIVHQRTFEMGREAGNGILALGDRVLVSVGNDIMIFDPIRLSFVHEVPIGHSCHWLVETGERTAGAFGNNQYWEIDVSSGTGHFITEVPGEVRASVMQDGKLYFAVDTHLYVFNRTFSEGLQ